MRKKQSIPPHEKVSLKLTAAERKLVLEDVMCLDLSDEQVIRDTPPDQPVMMIEAENSALWNELKSTNVDAMINELAEYKQQRFPDDRR